MTAGLADRVVVTADSTTRRGKLVPMKAIASAAAAGSQPGGEYTPMPPVFGPRSRSKTGLWSQENGMWRTVTPSVNACAEVSRPNMRSSITTRAPAAPKAWSRIAASMAATA